MDNEAGAQPLSEKFETSPLARRIAEACASGEKLALSAAECPQDLDQAEAVLFEVAAKIGRPAKAWKLGASTVGARRAQGFDHAWSAPLFEGEVLESPARLAAPASGLLGLECELVFRLGADIPKNGALSPSQVRDRVAGVRAGIEVPATRYSALGVYGAPALVADRGAAGYLVVGDEIQDWRPEGLDIMTARLLLDGREAVAGSGREIIGGPFGALCDHIERLRARGVEQRAGVLISIGSLTAFHLAPAGVVAVAEFSNLGSCMLELSKTG